MKAAVANERTKNQIYPYRENTLLVGSFTDQKAHDIQSGKKKTTSD